MKPPPDREMGCIPSEETIVADEPHAVGAQTESATDEPLDATALDSIAGGVGSALSGFSQMNQLEFQESVQQKNQAGAALANVMKSYNDTASSIVQNLKD
jgi:hypothetical protein